MVVFAIAGCGSDNTKLTCIELYNNWASMGSNFDSTYKGKILEITEPKLKRFGNDVLDGIAAEAINSNLDPEDKMDTSNTYVLTNVGENKNFFCTYFIDMTKMTSDEQQKLIAVLKSNPNLINVKIQGKLALCNYIERDKRTSFVFIKCKLKD